jgi:hypothetical protein
MPMQIIRHRDPVRTSGLATGLGAAGDTINSLLRIYTDHNKTKKLDAQQALENKWKEDEAKALATQRSEASAQRELQNSLVRRNLEEDALTRAGSRPEVKTGEETVDLAPDFPVNPVNENKPDATKTDFTDPPEIGSELANPLQTMSPNEAFRAQAASTPDAPDFSQSVTPQPEPVLGQRELLGGLDLQQPTETRDIMGPEPTQTGTVSPVMFGDEEFAPGYTQDIQYADEVKKKEEDKAREARGDVRLTPELRASLAPGIQALVANSEWISSQLVASVAADSMRPKGGGKPQSITNKQTGEVFEKDEQGKYTVLVGNVGVEAKTDGSPNPQEQAMMAQIVEGDASTIPIQYRAQVVAIAEGREKAPTRPNEYGVRLMNLVNTYDQSADMSTNKTRWDANRELTRAGPTSRGGQITNLNTFADHAKVLQKKADDLDDTVGSGPSEWANAIAQSVKLGQYRGPMNAYQVAADTFVGEYIKTLKGAAPTNEETRMFEKVRDTTLAPSARQAIIDTLVEFVESRANQQESWYYGVYGKNSWEDTTKRAWFEPREWINVGGIWKVRTKQYAKHGDDKEPKGGDTGGTKTEEWGVDENGNPVRITK